MWTERCEVSVVGAPLLSERGPTPVDAPLLANQLAAGLIDRLPANLAEPTVRFALDVRSLLTFSFELDASTLERLARIGAECEFCINADEPDFARFEAWSASADLEAYTANRDPHPITAALGVEPTTVRRADEPLEPGGRRFLRVGVWRFENEMRPPIDLDRLLRSMCDAVGSDLPTRCPNESLKTRLSLQINRLQGGFTLHHGAVERLAELRVPLGCYFYNMGA